MKQELFNNKTKAEDYQRQPKQLGLYEASHEHDACGVGMLVNIQGGKSHELVESALKVLENMRHRGAEGADNKTGDGAGIMLQIPHEFILLQGIPVPEKGKYGTGLLFLPKDGKDQAVILSVIIEEIEKEGLTLMHLRNVPTCPEILGEAALANEPDIKQIFITGFTESETADRKLYIIRKRIENRIRKSDIPTREDFYIVSLSTKNIVYKGMLSSLQLRNYFPDLTNSYFTSGLALVHSRFSTNTFPTWGLAQPFRLLAHNGEINTIRGNRGWMEARESVLSSPALGDIREIRPIVQPGMSDSASLDNVLEFLIMSGLSLPHAMAMLVPESFNEKNPISEDLKAFYEYHSILMEPWDGPASILFSDGDVMGAVLDRNGLRPSRYYITNDGFLILSSEVGVLEVPEEKIVLKERLHPGKMLLVNTVQGKVLNDEEVKEYYAKKQPYGEWLDSYLVQLKDIKIPNLPVEEYTKEERMRLQKAFGYTYEEYRSSIGKMALNGVEATASMGIDTPLAVLSHEHQPLFNYFKQLFAQVTNPPIDCIREEIVTSTSVYVGRDGNLLEEEPKNCQVLKINNPILTNTDMLKIKNMKVEGFKAVTVPITYYKSAPLDRAMDRLFVEVDRAHRAGANILILSDRGVDENHVAIPSLLAVSAVHQHLVKTKKRTSLAIILESGEPREVHHFATLLGYGACAINPYLALDTIHELIEEGMIKKDYYAAVEDYNHAVISGIVKIAAKMGISTIQSYQGSQIFEAIGISADVIDKYFTGTVSRVGGITLEDIAKDVDERHSQAFDPLELSTDLTLDSIGRHKSRSQGEEHRYNPRTIHTLQESTRRGDYKMFKEYTAMVDSEESGYLRSLMDFDYPEQGVPLEEVESVDSIVKRFKTGAMSYGSISQEAHETLAIAMNMLHGKSNTGEGGESDERLDSAGSKVDRCSAIKQVASGRFGVTSRYLVSAKEIQIKMAQGAKPGEGGHLPAKKVYPWIAKTRHSTPGVSLISPPPHHDIYSIEDLAELIYDLKNANKNARISVKLVSEAGVGTVAAGVAKAGAQVILISGYDGGTGAAPQSSIHNAGLPWELGLAETHQTLLMNGLRNRVMIETDGKLMSGRDVAIAALLGAEEFGFATAPLVTMGCVMMRVCNLDTCPVGVATQNPELRKRFRGKPEYVVNFMRFIAEELREYMAKLGIRTLDEMVGRTDLLKVKEHPESPMASKIDLSAILNNPFAKEGQKVTFDPAQVYDFKLEETKDEKILLKKLQKSIEKGEKASIDVEVTNTDRAFATILGAEITRHHKNGLPDDTITINCNGAGGQSFAAFVPKGLTLTLCGDCNDYMGKGLSGGKIVLYPPKKRNYKADENIITGNVALYGATSGTAYICGVAGERFAVRNSGAYAVVEGVGEHGCEYMTGGRVVVLGKTGKNFAAGMSGGVAYVLDDKNELYKNLNKSMISIEKVELKSDIQELHNMIADHVAATGSEKGQEVLDHFQEYLPKFKKIIPDDYKKMITMATKLEEMGMSPEEAQLEAFNENFQKGAE